MPLLAGLGLAKVEYELTAGYQERPGEPPHGLRMEYGVVCHRNDEQTRTVFVEVAIASQDADKPLPYRAKIAAAAGLNGFTPGQTPEAVDDQALQAGAPIAYAMVRDELLRLTGMSPYRRVLLPIIGRGDLLAHYTINDASGQPIAVVDKRVK